MGTIRVAMIDDHPSTILGVETEINKAKDMKFVGGFATLPEFNKNIRVITPNALHYPVDVVLLDLRLADNSLPYYNAIDLRKKSIKVLVYSSLDSPYLFRNVLGAGAQGLFLKERPMAELLSAIRWVAEGNTFTSSDWASAIDSSYKLLHVNLSPQQKTVLELIAAGETDRMIAKKLRISVNTVRDYINRIRDSFAKAGSTPEGRVLLVREGMRSGILRYPTDP